MRGKRQRIRRQLRSNKKGRTPHELASCFGKIRHSTYEEAKLACADKPDFVKPYKCEHCPYYHIGRRWKREVK